MVGRPPKFATPEQLQVLFEEWQNTFEPDPDKREKLNLNVDIPDVEGFCDYIDAYRDILCEYEKNKEFSDTIKRIKNWIYYKKKQLAMQNKMNPAIFIFDAKNNAGYVDRQEVESNDTITHKFEDLTDGELDRIIQERKDRAA